jgi:hypothetical protein
MQIIVVFAEKLATILMIAIGALMRVNYYQPDEWHSSNRIR